ncbi:RNA-binding protein Musashi homolog 2 [Homalodisca vitripennis]|uniref:RRM domain-containing protein n=1 Tax=Homalodisca liturata TaxID=320908 RepID=A0A1B6HNA8_9HEMI|nr:RNA-binding protein Musashi homolog 2 [Homalodisca vitripennis]XP_046686979.1 RNA-binding protein Musashi homolog 2 [Homalodisca vitripennis]XP_046686983.1 RNA-binding protein Musashi homolog 2 [Homalodisca vitripennis]XP_046686989.1 RNA-binding protein Musashi homolog 2 [Homalodisca vitripennis]XP_046686994.1 RNA-binding protein Musashi homolog 2 [Homalodisca vitripennis]XP_046687001.1 RNA-binding protein Musashi homolog 2 [Homalodisca vitripennis]XP_046687008.1 RNA-binding protein Musash
MADHHEAFNNMLQMNGLGLVHHLNGSQPQVEMNGTASSQTAENHRNGNTTPSQHLNTTTQNNSSTGGGNSSGRSSPNEDPAAAKLFVGGLSWQTSPDKLKEYFGMFGTVTDVLIMKDPLTQRSRGFGFITFSEPDTVEKVLKVPIHTLDGKKIDPKHATPKNRPKQSNRTKKIFVGGVSQDTSSEEVKAYFSQFGKVEETVMLMDQQTKRHRGFGFVTFENEDVVDRICEIHFHTIKNKKVECKKAQPKEVVAPGLLLGKRVMVMGGVRMATPTPVTSAGQLVAAQAHVQAAAAAAAAQNAAVQNAAAAVSYGKLFSGYPSLAGYRYAPYPVATIPATQPPATATAPATQALNPAAALAPPANPYQAYSLANVDMSSFQGVDWSSMYGMGMYV